MSSKSHQISDLISIIGYEYNTFFQYLETSSGMFENNTLNVKREIEEITLRLAKLSEKIDGDLDSYLNADYDALNSDLFLNEIELNAYREMKTMFANSSFVFLVTIFEGALKRLCETVIDLNKVQPKHIKESSYTMQGKIFLSKVIGIKLPDESLWARLRQYLELRNMIVHNNATAEKHPGKKIDSQPSGYKNIYSFKGLNISEYEEGARFYIEDLEFIREFGGFSNDIIAQIGAKLEEYVRITHP